MKKSFNDILNGLGRDMELKVAAKLPDWASRDLEFPTSLCLEQCSSSTLAARKARLAEEICGSGYRVADLTGGIGSDSYAFSRHASGVWYNEADPVLCAAAARNFAKLGADCISTHGHFISADDASWAAELRGFRPDIIYLDPARRDGAGRKVFLLEDCSPDIAALLPELLGIAPRVMVKLSPMADLTMVCRRLGGHVSELHIAGLGGECKELLCIAGRDKCTLPLMVVENGGSEVFRFTPEEEAAAHAAYLPDEDALGSFSILLEPTPALMKSGCRKLLSSRFGLTRMGRATNLYLAAEGTDIPSGLFRQYRLQEALPFGKDAFRKLSASGMHADVTARNLPLGSEELARRAGVLPGDGNTHIFGATVDYIGTQSSATQRMLFITQPYNRQNR